MIARPPACGPVLSRLQPTSTTLKRKRWQLDLLRKGTVGEAASRRGRHYGKSYTSSRTVLPMRPVHAATSQRKLSFGNSITPVLSLREGRGNTTGLRSRSQRRDYATAYTGDGEDHGLEERQADGLWGQFNPSNERSPEDGQESQEEVEVTAQTTPQGISRSESGIRYRTEIEQALLRNEPDRLLRAFLAASHDPEYIAEIPDTTFSQILSMITPERFIGHLVPLSTRIRKNILDSRGVVRLEEGIKDYLEIILRIRWLRAESGRKMNIIDYTFLLNCARQSGSSRLAKYFWAAMKSDGVKPNTQCYNHYMGALVWDAVLLGHVKHARYYRVWPRFLRQRQEFPDSDRFHNKMAFRVGPGGLREEITSIFNQMLLDEVIADEATFRHLMVGLAREGDITGVKAMLKRVWHIDVDHLVSCEDESELNPVAPYSRSSPLYPTPKLLFALAHSFSINSDMPTALRLVDYVSRQYEIDPTEEVWTELLEWTVYLASQWIDRTATPEEKAPVLGQWSVVNFFETMTAEPYNVEPTLPMFNYLLEFLYRHNMYREMWLYITRAIPLYKKARKDTFLAYRALYYAVKPRDEPSSMIESENMQPSIPLETLRRAYESAVLLSDTASRLLMNWIQRLQALSSRIIRLKEQDPNLDWAVRIFPQLIGQYSHSLGEDAVYHTAAGRIELFLHSSAETVKRHASTRRRNLGRARVFHTGDPRLVGDEWVVLRSPVMPLALQKLLDERGGSAEDLDRLLEEGDLGFVAAAMEKFQQIAPRKRRLRTAGGALEGKGEVPKSKMAGLAERVASKGPATATATANANTLPPLSATGIDLDAVNARLAQAKAEREAAGRDWLPEYSPKLKTKPVPFLEEGLVGPEGKRREVVDSVTRRVEAKEEARHKGWLGDS
ncbi:hypothetical protein M8818_000588 [Zalaria obscura]|uniref:Uncharacterized protein n=1 Tax=Zalaria obscura TaxID=2024903 RepID=A0ACC3SPX6_9PEZI